MQTPHLMLPAWRRRVLGWLHMERGVPLAELRLANILPSSDRAGVAVAFDYVQWLVTERSISAFTQGTACHGTVPLPPHATFLIRKLAVGKARVVGTEAHHV